MANYAVPWDVIGAPVAVPQQSVMSLALSPDVRQLLGDISKVIIAVQPVQSVPSPKFACDST